MLLSYSVENYKSFKEKCEISFHAIAKNEGSKAVDLLECPKYTKHGVVSSAMIFGANAAGKSNFLKSLKRFCYVAVSSLSKPLTDKLPAASFKLDPKYRTEPSCFDIDFIAGDGVRYVYELSFDQEQITHEALYCYPEGRERMLFKRETHDGKAYVKFGTTLKGERKLSEKNTREDATFLSTATQYETFSQLLPVYNYLEELIKFSDSKELLVDYKEIMQTRLCDFGAGEVELALEKKEIPPEGRAVFQALKNTLISGGVDIDEDNFDEITMVVFKRKDLNGDLIKFEEYEESSGTRKLLGQLPIILDALEKGTIAVIDEIDENIHTSVVQQIIAWFNSKETNPKGAQLLATLHDTNVLNCNYIRKDQVYLVEKNNNMSNLYALIDFKTRTKNFEKSYLEGRYGAIPML